MVEQIEINSTEREVYEELVDSQQQKSTISKNDLELVKILGVGAYGKVALVKHKQTGIRYAMKQLKIKEIERKQQHKYIMEERRILEKANHPFIVSMAYAFKTSTKLTFVLDYCPGGELFFYLQQVRRFKEDAALFYSANICVAIEYLHKINVIYRDLKPENILVGRDGYLKIADFGLSRSDISEQMYGATSIVGTAEYLAPEVLSQKKNGGGYGKAADWWCFGCLIYEFLCGIPPFYDDKGDQRKLNQKILNQEPDLSWSFLTPEAKDLLRGLLQKDPQKRYNSEQVRKHPWFKNINFEMLEEKRIVPPYVPQLMDEDDTIHFPAEFTDMLPSPNEASASLLSNDKFKDFDYVCEGLEDEHYNQSDSTEQSNKMELD